VATGICQGYRDRWVHALQRHGCRVGDAKARKDFQQYLDDAEIAHQQQLRGRKRRVAGLTLEALERTLRAADLLIVNLGIRSHDLLWRATAWPTSAVKISASHHSCNPAYLPPHGEEVSDGLLAAG
jgi:hypothetical protein